MKRRDLLKLIGISPLAPTLLKASESNQFIKTKKPLISELEILQFLEIKGYSISSCKTVFDMHDEKITTTIDLRSYQSLPFPDLVRNQQMRIGKIIIPILDAIMNVYNPKIINFHHSEPTTFVTTLANKTYDYRIILEIMNARKV